MNFVHEPSVEMSAICCDVLTYLIEIMCPNGFCQITSPNPLGVTLIHVSLMDFVDFEDIKQCFMMERVHVRGLCFPNRAGRLVWRTHGCRHDQLAESMCVM